MSEGAQFSIDDLAYALRSLSPVDLERLFDRLTEAEAEGLFEVALWWRVEEFESAGYALDEANTDRAALHDKIDDLNDEILDLKDEIEKLEERENA